MSIPVENGPVVALGAPISHTDFAQLVGVSQQAISKMVSDGRLPAEGSAGALLRSYCQHLREVAAGRASAAGGGLDLVQERAALARSQREAVDLRNAVTKSEYAPVTLLGRVLATASQAVSEGLEQLPGMLKRVCPDLPDAARNQIMTTIASARNEWVKKTTQLVAERLAEEDGGEGESDDA